MSAKIPRRSFAAPLVVTLAVPACIVSSKPAPEPSGSSVRDRRTHTNPPRPAPDTTEHPGHQPTPPPRAPQPGNDTVQQTPPPVVEAPPMRSWTVMLQGKDCYTSYDIVCPPKGATCNPPPPLKMKSCPSGITAERPLHIKEDAANACALYYPMPECPTGVACNPPRPQKIECPTR